MRHLISPIHKFLVMAPNNIFKWKNLWQGFNMVVGKECVYEHYSTAAPNHTIQVLMEPQFKQEESIHGLLTLFI